jgi:hypothetical protein
VGASLCVQTGIGEAEAFDGAAVEEMFGDDLLDVFDVDEAVPDRLRVDDEHGTVLALVETGRLVGADGLFEAGVFNGVLEGGPELFAVLGTAAGAGGAFVALVVTDEEVMFELWHVSVPFLLALIGLTLFAPKARACSVCGTVGFLRQ